MASTLGGLVANPSSPKKLRGPDVFRDAATHKGAGNTIGVSATRACHRARRHNRAEGHPGAIHVEETARSPNHASAHAADRLGPSPPPFYVTAGVAGGPGGA